MVDSFSFCEMGCCSTMLLLQFWNRDIPCKMLASFALGADPEVTWNLSLKFTIVRQAWDHKATTPRLLLIVFGEARSSWPSWRWSWWQGFSNSDREVCQKYAWQTWKPFHPKAMNANCYLCDSVLGNCLLDSAESRRKWLQEHTESCFSRCTSKSDEALQLLYEDVYNLEIVFKRGADTVRFPLQAVDGKAQLCWQRPHDGEFVESGIPSTMVTTRAIMKRPSASTMKRPSASTKKRPAACRVVGKQPVQDQDMG